MKPRAILITSIAAAALIKVSGLAVAAPVEPASFALQDCAREVAYRVYAQNRRFLFVETLNAINGACRDQVHAYGSLHTVGAAQAFIANAAMEVRYDVQRVSQ